MGCFWAEIIRRLAIKKFKGFLKWFNNLKGSRFSVLSSGFLAQTRNADGNKRIEKGNAEFRQQAAR